MKIKDEVSAFSQRSMSIIDREMRNGFREMQTDEERFAEVMSNSCPVINKLFKNIRRANGQDFKNVSVDMLTTTESKTIDNQSAALIFEKIILSTVPVFSLLHVYSQAARKNDNVVSDVSDKCLKSIVAGKILELSGKPWLRNFSSFFGNSRPYEFLEELLEACDDVTDTSNNNADFLLALLSDLEYFIFFRNSCPDKISPDKSWQRTVQGQPYLRLFNRFEVHRENPNSNSTAITTTFDTNANNYYLNTKASPTFSPELNQGGWFACAPGFPYETESSTHLYLHGEFNKMLSE